MKWTLRQKITLISLFIACTFLAIYLLHNNSILQAKALMSFDPIDYGLPLQMGGYQVIAVVPSENMSCAAPDGIELVLYAIPNEPQTLTREDLDKLVGIVGRRVQTSIAYNMMTFEEVKSLVEYQNKTMWPVGCAVVHTGLVTFTPRPDPTMVPKKGASFDPVGSGLSTQNSPITSPTPDYSSIATSVNDTPTPVPNNGPAPQFLYRDKNHLILVNGYTGASTELPFEVSDQDHFVWSPDGKYIQASLYVEHKGFCLNLYDPDKQVWVYSQPIACGVQEAFFSRDNSRIFYSTYEQSQDQTNTKMWVYNLQDETRRALYGISSSSQQLFGDAFINLKWSPTGSYLTFESSQFGLNGNNVSFVIVNLETGKSATLAAPSTYDATYNPIWSADDRWFVVMLKDQYAGVGAEPAPDDRGDLYLVNSETGKEYRLTYTPTAAEIAVHWTEDGKIAYTEVTEQKLTLTLEEAMTVKVVPADQIITPEPVEAVYHNMWEGYIISPNKNIAAWLSQQSQGDKNYRLVVGSIASSPPIETYSVPISEPDQRDSILIGWRPSDYPYLRG